MRSGCFNCFLNQSLWKQALDRFPPLPHGVIRLTGPRRGEVCPKVGLRPGGLKQGWAQLWVHCFPGGFKCGRWRPLVAHRHHASPTHLQPRWGRGFPKARLVLGDRASKCTR